MPGCLGPKKSPDASHAGHPCLEVRPAARKALPMPRDLMAQVKIQKCGDEVSHDFRPNMQKSLMTYWCQVRRVAGWVGGCWDEKNDS